MKEIYGPNDGGYIHQILVKVAKDLRRAQELYSEGHYPHSNAKVIEADHPLRIAMDQLAILDKEYARFANTQPDELLFSTYEPPLENTIRWNETRPNHVRTIKLKRNDSKI